MVVGYGKALRLELSLEPARELQSPCSPIVLGQAVIVVGKLPVEARRAWLFICI